MEHGGPAACYDGSSQLQPRAFQPRSERSNLEAQSTSGILRKSSVTKAIERAHVVLPISIHKREMTRANLLIPGARCAAICCAESKSVVCAVHRLDGLFDLISIL